MTFPQWMIAVDGICLAAYGMSLYDLPDMCYRDSYDDGLTPEEFMAEQLPDAECLRELLFG